MILTNSVFEDAKSSNGGWSYNQIRILGVKTFKKGWRKNLIGKDFPEPIIKKFIELKDEHIHRRIEKKKKQLKKVKKKKRPKKQFSPLDKLARKAFLMKGTYQEWLKTKYWYEVKKLVFARDGKICRICKSEKNLEVHHDTYKNHFQEHRHLEDLMVLCRTCHQDFHDNLDTRRKL